jgi:hypothetical protein
MSEKRIADQINDALANGWRWNGNAYVCGDRIARRWQDLPHYCPGCKNEIDPEVCHCGDPKHIGHDNHNFVPMGCDCGRMT